jgi:hypothetical protein
MSGFSFPLYNFRFPAEEVSSTTRFVSTPQGIIDCYSDNSSPYCPIFENIPTIDPNTGFEIPEGVAPSKAQQVYSQGGKFLPLTVDGQQIFIPVYPNWTPSDLLQQISRYAFRGNAMVSFIDGTDTSLGIFPAGITNVTTALGPAGSSNRIRNPAHLADSNFRGMSIFRDAVQLYVL